MYSTAYLTYYTYNNYNHATTYMLCKNLTFDFIGDVTQLFLSKCNTGYFK